MTRRVADFVTVGCHNLHQGRATPTGFADIIGWQEAEGRACRRRIRKLDGYGHYPAREDAGGRLGPGRNTISWDEDRFRLLGAGHQLAAHGGMRGRLPLFITWVRLADRFTGQQVKVFNVHFPNGAWAAEDGRVAMPYTGRRRGQWRRYREALKRRVRHAQRNGLAVVVLGDTNRHRWGVLPLVTEIRPRKPAARPGYDRIGVSGAAVDGPLETLSRAGSDHRRLRATIRPSVKEWK